VDDKLAGLIMIRRGVMIVDSWKKLRRLCEERSYYNFWTSNDKLCGFFTIATKRKVIFKLVQWPKLFVELEMATTIEATYPKVHGHHAFPPWNCKILTTNEKSGLKRVWCDWKRNGFERFGGWEARAHDRRGAVEQSGSEEGQRRIGSEDLGFLASGW